MSLIKVYPTHPNALNISHPASGKLSEEGSMWLDDSFTARMLTDGAVTTEEPAKVSAAKPRKE